MAKEHAARIGRRIRERRDELGLTQPAVAALMVDSPSTNDQQISKWERGVHKPSDDNLEILARALKTTVADLVSGPVAEREPTDTRALVHAVNGAGEPDSALERLERIEGKLDDVLELLATDRDAADGTGSESSGRGSRETSDR